MTMALFRRVGIEVAGRMGFIYPLDLDQGVTAFVQNMRRVDHGMTSFCSARSSIVRRINTTSSPLAWANGKPAVFCGGFYSMTDRSSPLWWIFTLGKSGQFNHRTRMRSDHLCQPKLAGRLHPHQCQRVSSLLHRMACRSGFYTRHRRQVLLPDTVGQVSIPDTSHKTFCNRVLLG